MNKVILMGRLVKDPEKKITRSGISAVRFHIAVNRRFAKPDDEIKADFIECVAWRNTADFVEKYFKKGQPIALTGSLQVRKWQDKDRNTRYSTEVIVEEVYFAGRYETAEGDFKEVSDDVELPF